MSDFPSLSNLFVFIDPSLAPDVAGMCLFGLQAVSAQSWKNNRTRIDYFISMRRARASTWLKFLCELNFMEFKFLWRAVNLKRFVRIHDCDTNLKHSKKHAESFVSFDWVDQKVNCRFRLCLVDFDWMGSLICDRFFSWRGPSLSQACLRIRTYNVTANMHLLPVYSFKRLP